MSGTIAALTIPFASYWAFPILPIASYTAGMIYWEVFEDARGGYRSRWFEPLLDLLDPDDPPTIRIIRGLLGNTVLMVALIIVVVRVGVHDLPDAALLGVWALIPVVVLLVAAALFDDMPWGFAVIQAGIWLLKLVLGSVAIADMILYPEHLYE